MLIPSGVRTWAPRGKPPRLRIAGHWTKISAISAISVSPRRKRLALSARFYPGQHIRSPEGVAFPQQLRRHLRGPVVLLWDAGTPHKGKLVTVFLQRHPRRHTYRFPGDAPELNPDECVWCHLKRLLHPPLQRLRQSQPLLWSCIYASDLPWR